MQPALTLVFVETKRGADNLEHCLSRNGFSAIAIHGDKVQMVSTVWLLWFLFFRSLMIVVVIPLCYTAVDTA